MPDLTIFPATPDRWTDFETLFGPRGAIGGCWCMWWRLTRAEYERQKGEGNKGAMQAIVASSEVPGLMAYAGDQPVAWCSVAPREAFPSLDRSRVLKRVDEQPVWSVVCFFITKPYRGQGVSVQMLRAALDYAGQHSARIVEGYPIEPKKDSAPDIYAFTGMASAFRKAGFVEVLRRSETRPIMRYFIE